MGQTLQTCSGALPTMSTRFLRGAKPGRTKFDLIINLTTAKALGLTIAEPLLLRADKVIE
jgi:putative ABC transport system substrate-binding protein